MRLKLTVRSEPGDQDVVVSCDATATVGDVASALFRQTAQQRLLQPVTLWTDGGVSGVARVLSPLLSVHEAGIGSGALVSVTSPESADAAFVTAQATVVVEEPRRERRTVPLGDGVAFIGRDPASQIRLNDPKVSRRHASLHVDRVVSVADRGSANGITVDGDRVERAVLSERSELRIGDTVLRVQGVVPAGGADARPARFSRSPRVASAWAERSVQAPELPRAGEKPRLPWIGVVAPFSSQRDAIAALEAEAEYLGRATAGDVQLYLYNKEGNAIIEMIGDPSTATEVLSYVPGTRTQMESFYGDPMDSITGFARRQVQLAPRDHSVVAFVFKDGFFPQTDNLIANGPQHNTMASSLGATYERFLAGVDAVVPGRPVVSVEHSFGSAVAGAAEMHGDGVNLEARVLLAGIGMTSEWSAQDGTDYFAFQAADDMNTYFEGIEAGDLGYAVRPEASNGIRELDAELNTPYEISKYFLPSVQALRFANGLENHGLIVSPHETENRAVLFGVRDILAGERPTS